MNKPRGIVTTASDEQGRDTIYSLLDASWPWLGPVGRLDKASEGLLLLTNDSEWGARVAAPETHLEKTYHAQIGCLVDSVFIQNLLNGVRSDGDLLRARQARLLRWWRHRSQPRRRAGATVGAGSDRAAATGHFGEGDVSPAERHGGDRARSRDAKQKTITTKDAKEHKGRSS